MKPPEGESAGARLERALATGPAWPICAAAAAPSAWTASVRRRRPGTVSSFSSRQCRSVRPFGRHREVGHRGHGRAAGGDAAVERRSARR